MGLKFWGMGLFLLLPGFGKSGALPPALSALRYAASFCDSSSSPGLLFSFAVEVIRNGSGNQPVFWIAFSARAAKSAFLSGAVSIINGVPASAKTWIMRDFDIFE